MLFIAFLKSELGATGQALPGSVYYSSVLSEAFLKYLTRLYSFSESHAGTCELRTLSSSASSKDFSAFFKEKH